MHTVSLLLQRFSWFPWSVAADAQMWCPLQDKRLAWYDLDLSTKPYRALRYHSHALRSVAFHKKYPLFASASDDASVHIFHGMVYQVGSLLLANAFGLLSVVMPVLH